MTKISGYGNDNSVLNKEGGKTMTKPNPDDRSDNVEKLQDMVQNTLGKY